MHLPDNHLSSVEIAEADLVKLANFTRTYCGINFSKNKFNMLKKRVLKHMEEMKVQLFEEYLNRLKVSSELDRREINEYINHITIQETFFFRQPAHFNYLQNTIIPSLLKTNAGQKRIHILSLCCATGEEPYSLAICLYNSMIQLRGWDLVIDAIDISSNAIKAGEKGEYAADSRTFSEMRTMDLNRYFILEGTKATIRPEIKAMVRFKLGNILTETLKSGYDIIFCRNALIYFNNHHRDKIITKIHQNLKEKGHFFLGYSETLYGWENIFRTIRIPNGLLFQKDTISQNRNYLDFQMPAESLADERKNATARSTASPEQSREVGTHSTFSIQQFNDKLRINITGKIDNEEEAYSEDKLAATEKHLKLLTTSKIIIDTSKLKFINISGIEILAKIARTVFGKDGEIVAYVPNKNIYALFERAGLDVIFEIFESYDEAIESLEQGAKE